MNNPTMYFCQFCGNVYHTSSRLNQRKCNFCGHGLYDALKANWLYWTSLRYGETWMDSVLTSKNYFSLFLVYLAQYSKPWLLLANFPVFTCDSIHFRTSKSTEIAVLTFVLQSITE
mgnify:CR=1 FL=1